MADQQRSFDRKHLDDEIEQLMRINDSDDLAETPDARLIADLRHAHQMDEVMKSRLPACICACKPTNTTPAQPLTPLKAIPPWYFIHLGKDGSR